MTDTIIAWRFTGDDLSQPTLITVDDLKESEWITFEDLQRHPKFKRWIKSNTAAEDTTPAPTQSLAGTYAQSENPEAAAQ